MIRRLRNSKFRSLRLVSKAREGRIFQKLIQKNLTQEKEVFHTPKLLTKSCVSHAYENEFFSRRMIVMNKVFMEKLTEMLNQMDCGKWLAELHIEITKVKINYNFEYIDIFWITRRAKTPEKILNEVLQVTLRQLQERIGIASPFKKVPYLRFVRDVNLENALNLEKTFKLVDFGKDFNPAYDGKVCRQGFSKNPEDLPLMRHDVLGVDVAAIKGKILAHVKKYKAININTYGNELVPRPGPIMNKLIQFNKKDFIKHYKRSRIEELKMRKKERSDRGLYEDAKEVHWSMLNNIYQDLYEDENEEVHQDLYENLQQDEDEEIYEDLNEKLYKEINNKHETH